MQETKRVAYMVVQQNSSLPIFEIALVREFTIGYIIQSQFGTFRNKESAETIVKTLNQEMGISPIDANNIHKTTVRTVVNKEPRAWIIVPVEEGFRLGLVRKGAYGFTMPQGETYKTYELAQKFADGLNEKLGVTREQAWDIIKNSANLVNERPLKLVEDCPIFYAKTKIPSDDGRDWEIRLKLKDMEFIMLNTKTENAAQNFIMKFSNAWLRHFSSNEEDEKKVEPPGVAPSASTEAQPVAEPKPQMKLKKKEGLAESTISYDDILLKFKESPLFKEWRANKMMLEHALRTYLAQEKFLNSLYDETEFKGLLAFCQKDKTMTSEVSPPTRRSALLRKLAHKQSQP